MTKRYDEYKDSGIEWLGEIPSHWDTIRLKDKISISSGKSATKTDEGYLLYGANGIIGKTNNYNIDRKKIIIGRVGSCGAINIAKERSFISDNALIVDEKSILFDYLYYLLINKNLANLASKVAMPLITATVVLEEKSPFINDNTEQQAIADYLDNKTSKIDSAVAELEKQKSLLIELKKSTIHQAVTKGLDLTVPMKDSGVEWIGEVPSHWVFSKMNNLFTFEKGKNAQIYNKEYILDEKKSGKYPVYSGQTENFGIMGKINTYEYDFNSVIFVTTVGAKFMTPSYLSGKLSLSQNCLLIKNRKDIENKYYFYFLMAQFIEERKKIACIIQPSLRIEDLKKLTNLTPKKSEQIKIANYLDKKTGQIDQSIEVIDNQIAKMKEYKKILINDVVTGKIKVV